MICHLCRQPCKRDDVTDTCSQFALAYLSPSQMTDWLQCQFHWLGGHGLRLETPVKSAQVFGSAAHKAIAYDHRYALPFGKHAAISDVCDVFAAEFEGRVKSEEVVWDNGDNPGAVKDHGVKCVRKYREDVAPTIRPVLVEERFRARLQSPPLLLVGRVDIADHIATVYETKTAKGKPNQAQVDRNLQITAYSLGYYVRRKRVPQRFCLDAIVKTKEPRVERICTQRTDADLQRFCKLAGVVATQIESAVRDGRYAATGINHPFCNPQKCEFGGLCDWKGE